jgi:ribose transport system permease protein
MNVTPVLRRFARMPTVWTFLVLLVLAVAFGFAAPGRFATPFNIGNLLTNSAILLVMSVGMTYVIITAGIDLSVGSVLVFSGVIAAKVMEAFGGKSAGWGGIWLGILAGLATGAAWGVVNGLLVAKLRVPALIATLGTFGMALGLAQVLTGGSDITGVPAKLSSTVGFGKLGDVLPFLSQLGWPGQVLGRVTWLVVIAGLIALVFGALLTMTRFGRHTYAIGSNPEAARRVGINVERHLLKVYALAGLLSAAASMLSLARFTTTTIASHTTDNLGAIAGVVIGGASLFGGVGTVAGTVIGVLIPGVLQNGLIILGVQRFWLSVAVGAVLVAAVYFDQLRRRARERD